MGTPWDRAGTPPDVNMGAIAPIPPKGALMQSPDCVLLLLKFETLKPPFPDGLGRDRRADHHRQNSQARYRAFVVEPCGLAHHAVDTLIRHHIPLTLKIGPLAAP